MTRVIVTLALLVLAFEAVHRARYATSRRRMMDQLAAMGVR